MENFGTDYLLSWKRIRGLVFPMITKRNFCIFLDVNPPSTRWMIGHYIYSVFIDELLKFTMYWFYSDLSIFLHRILLSFAPLVICIIWDVIRIVQQLKFSTTDLKNEESLRHNISHISDDWTFNRYGYRRNQQQEIIPMQHLNNAQVLFDVLTTDFND